MCGNDPAVGLLLLSLESDVTQSKTDSNQTLRKSLIIIARYSQHRNQSFSRLHDKSFASRRNGEIMVLVTGVKREGPRKLGLLRRMGIIGIIEK